MSSLLFSRSGRLFANPSLVEGIGRVFDLFGNNDVYNENLTPQEVDNQAIYSDWASVGDHLVLAAQELTSDAR